MFAYDTSMALVGKKRTLLWGTLISLLLMIFAIGPRPNLSGYSVKPVQLPEDLDGYLANNEIQIPDLRPGTQKSILWASAEKTQTPLALAYLHGFSASRGEISPVVENVARELHANTFFTRFSGHGQDGKALSKATAAQFLDDGFEALAIIQRLGQKRILIGTSTGGAIAAYLAAHATEVDALVLISPNFALKDKRTRLFEIPWGVYLGKLLVGPERAWTPRNELESRYWTTRYPLESLLPMLAVTKQLSPQQMRQIQAPTLILYTSADDRVDTGLIENYFQAISAKNKRLIRLEEATSHVLAGDAVSPHTTPTVTTKIVEFLRTL